MSDEPELRDMAALCQQMSLDELRRFCEGTLRAAALGQRIFRARFPHAWETFNDAVESGALTMLSGDAER